MTVKRERWEWYNGCSWWRLGIRGDQMRHDAILCPTIDRDGHPNLAVSQEHRDMIERLPETLDELDELRAEVERLRTPPKPTTDNPCSVCGVPIYGSFIGTGDGTMKDGGSFAHPECYWRAEAESVRTSLREITEAAQALVARIEAEGGHGQAVYALSRTLSARLGREGKEPK